jgi:hypothetical protein
VFIVAVFVFSTARLLITILRFRLQIDAHSVTYRGMFRESSYPRAQIGVLRWDPGGGSGRNQQPSYLLFKDNEGDGVFSILGSLLSSAQLQEISQAMHRPILDLPEH